MLLDALKKVNQNKQLLNDWICHFDIVIVIWTNDWSVLSYI